MNKYVLNGQSWIDVEILARMLFDDKENWNNICTKDNHRAMARHLLEKCEIALYGAMINEWVTGFLEMLKTEIERKIESATAAKIR